MAAKRARRIGFESGDEIDILGDDPPHVQQQPPHCCPEIHFKASSRLVVSITRLSSVSEFSVWNCHVVELR